MSQSDDWTIEVYLGGETAIFGRIRESDGLVAQGEGRQNGQYNQTWLVPFKDSATQHGGAVKQRETELSRRCPERESGRLPEGAHGFFGGSVVTFADYVVATWGAVGGAAGILAFLKILRELQSFWKTNQSVKITLKDGTKVELHDKSGIDVAIAAINALEENLNKRMEEDGRHQKPMALKPPTTNEDEVRLGKQPLPQKRIGKGN